ncbi:ABC transporter ATP-binding protein [Parabacteroides sp. 52]|uniref:ABC transporter ATP-binding protein n=1 Tax=unclassified Parabacteroides TaxID=2649774 RepID=UPI0013D1DC2D|nr:MULTISPECIES: ABC transporter ATP-binding protein [unclassified Parabacteroides]MDH6534281.1 iron complex transport system ATP-binding protein [Parabacteroides sp. PM5-20]NDV55335.1 ABC transporter ATP-binding protein [Parabacteroides sp. 52]
MKSSPVIETSNLSIGYLLKGGHRKVVHDSLDIQVHTGEVTCLLGLNGAGKSTLLRTLCGFQPPLAGTIQLMGKPLESYSQNVFSLTVGVVLTEKTNAGGITVYELVSLGRHPYTGFFGQLKKEDHLIIEESIEAVGISHKKQNYVSELSDGERQKVMIAKTLAQQCPIIILDEPTAFLDVTSRIETMVLLRQLATQQQKAILLSTHDLDLAIQMGDRLWLQEKQRPMVCGTPEDLILSGSFESFFKKEGIVFDPSTGKLNTTIPETPIGVEGDFLTSYWVGNALVRKGYRPSPVNKQHININCLSPKQLIISYPEQKQKEVNSIESLLLSL